MGRPAKAIKLSETAMDGLIFTQVEAIGNVIQKGSRQELVA